MNLFEILDSRPKFHVMHTEPNMYATQARIGNRDIYFSTRRIPKTNSWTIQFSERTRKGIKGVNDNFGTTGSGNELEVFSFVLNSIKKFIRAYHPDEMNFSSLKSEGRSELYSKLVNRNLLPGYSFAGTKDKGKSDVFSVVKDNLKIDK